MTSLGASVCALVVAILIFLALSPTVEAETTSSPQPISLQDYISELNRCASALSDSGNDPTEVRDLRLSLPKQWAIHAGDQTYFVDSDWLAADLAKAEAALHKDPSVLRQDQEDLAAHREAAQALAQGSSSRNLNNSKAALDRILTAKEFQTIQGPTWLESLRARIYDWIARQFQKLYAKFPRGQTIGSAIAWTVIALTTLVLLLWMVRAATRGGARPQMDLRGASATGQDSAYWLRQARAAAASGDYRSAIHAAYWAAIARLEEAKRLTEDRSRTPRESLCLIRRESAEYAPLSQLTRRFELVWYGYRSAGSADWSDAMQELETLGCLRSSTPAISAS
jgi:Domain of unknown function (DUF4129)